VTRLSESSQAQTRYNSIFLEAILLFLGAGLSSSFLGSFRLRSLSSLSTEEVSTMAAMPKPTDKGAKATVLLGSQWGDEGKGV
jgi:hypothetical protein